MKKQLKQEIKVQRILRKTNNVQNLLEYKRLQAEGRKVIKSAKRDNWRDYCEKIGRTTHISCVWGMIRKMKEI